MSPVNRTAATGILTTILAIATMNAADITVSEFGKMPDGTPVQAFTLSNDEGTTATVIEYGAILHSIKTADKDGASADITHGYDDLAGWLTNTSYFGATVGRFGNRIANGKFELDGKAYQLATNNEPGGIPCHLHGGEKGFDKVLWKGVAAADGSASVTLTYTAADGEEGYPGALSLAVTYTLNDENQLSWDCKATTDAPTVLNIVHHPYWNLSGDPSTSINDHHLTLHADAYLPTDAGLIPTGKPAPVAGTPLDFQKPTVIGDRVEDEFEALELGAGYDHCWVLNSEIGKGGLRPAATLTDPETGRSMSIATNQPAIQFYGGNFLDGTAEGRAGHAYTHRTAMCLETENWPDAPNNAEAPNSVLRPGETYHHQMVYTFEIED